MIVDMNAISTADIQKEIVTIDEARLQVLAAEINVIEERTKATVLAAACEIGKRLTEVKNGLPRGRFLEWVVENTRGEVHRLTLPSENRAGSHVMGHLAPFHLIRLGWASITL